MKRLFAIGLLSMLMGCSGQPVGHTRSQEILKQQLEMNPVTLAKLQENGLTADTKVRLDFVYVAASEASARSLVNFLKRETDYEVYVEEDGQSAPQWIVGGTTQPTTIDLPILNQWVDWMVTVGSQHDCAFDGWGAEI